MGIDKKRFDFLINVFKIQEPLAKSTRLPLIGKLANTGVNRKTMQLTYVPINQDIEVPPGISAPLSLIEHFINRASHHVILKKCPCRTVLNCESHERNFGCTFIGEGAREISADLGDHVTKEEAIKHLHEAADAGLISLIGKFNADAVALNVKQKSRLMTICHCCECCCVSKSVHYAAKPFRELIVKLEGIELEVTDACEGCAECVTACVFNQIKIVGGKATIGEECKGCGRCADACPRGAINIKVTDPSYIDAYTERISSILKIN